jgi:signal peptidase I
LAARSSSRHKLRSIIALAAAFGAVASIVRGVALLPIARYVVDGPSMEPAYRAGDRLLVNRLAYVRRPPRVGDVVVARDPEHAQRLLLKRVASVVDDRHIYVLGDNAAESRDSRTFGAIKRSHIVGRAWRTY